jgi:glycosyltransferase involved in cell wall biosynthesis
MKVALSIDALAPQSTGIGRYTWELVRGIPNNPGVSRLLYYRNGMIAMRPEAFLASGGHRFSKGRLWGERLKARFVLHGSLFHGPNFFLPDSVEGGVITVHDLSVLKFPQTHPAERVQMFEAKFESSLSRAAHILTDCEHGRSELIGWFGLPPERVTAVSLGVAEVFRPRGEAECIEVLRKYGIEQGGFALCVATFEPRKRILSAIDAYMQAVKAHSAVPLVLVGAAGWNNTTLKEHIARAARSGHILPLGYVDEGDLPYIYAAARLFLYPSIYEGFGLPPIEAMACGVPTIVSNRSCLPEVTQGAAMLVDPDDIDGFSRAIERGLSDDIWRSRAIQVGLRVAAGYTWRTCVEKTVDVYRKVHCEMS